MNKFDVRPYVNGLLLLSLGLLGVSFILGANKNAINAVFSFYHLVDIFTLEVLSVLTGAVFVIAAVSSQLSTPFPLIKKVAIYLLLLISVIPLVTLLSEQRWIASLGGFPILGSGQGIIKYFALLPLILYLFFKTSFSPKQHLWFNFIAVASVLIWIGGLKFYEFEAKGIESLVSTSPFMSWMYSVWSIQGASNVIGAYDWLITALLGIGLFFSQRKLIIIGILGAGTVFIVTQTFIFTTGNGFNESTILTGLSQFIIKDLWYIANLLVIWEMINPKEL